MNALLLPPHPLPDPLPCQQEGDPSTGHHSCPHTVSSFDWTLLGLAIAATLPFLLANALVFRFRKRKYFQAQGGADLILAGSAAGLIWIAATFVINGHFPRDQRFLKICALWSFWLELTVGFCLWLLCLSLRLYRLYRLCTRKELASIRRTWTVHIPLLLSPAFIYSMIASFVHAIYFYEKPGNSPANCLYRDGWKFGTFFTLPPLYFSMVVILLCCIRGQKDYMLRNEYLHTSDYSMMAFIVYLLTGATYVIGSQHKVSGRLFLTFCVCFLVFSHFWVRLGWPVYLCLCRPKSEMDNFEDELRWCGAECFDSLQIFAAFRNFGGPTTLIPASQLHDNDWIVRAIDAAMVEASELKAKIEQLEKKRSRLIAKIKELEPQSGSSTLIPPSGNASAIQLINVISYNSLVQ